MPTSEGLAGQTIPAESRRELYYFLPLYAANLKANPLNPWKTL